MSCSDCKNNVSDRCKLPVIDEQIVLESCILFTEKETEQ